MPRHARTLSPSGIYHAISRGINKTIIFEEPGDYSMFLGIVKKCKEAIQRDSIAWTNVCEEKMFDSPILKTLGLMALPDNLVLVNGRVVAHALPFNELEKEIERHLQDKNV